MSDTPRTDAEVAYYASLPFGENFDTRKIQLYGLVVRAEKMRELERELAELREEHAAFVQKSNGTISKLLQESARPDVPIFELTELRAATIEECADWLQRNAGSNIPSKALRELLAVMCAALKDKQ